MGSKVEYVESSHIYATNYIRNSKAIGVLWGIFTICYAIIGVVAFVTPEWIGETLEAEYPGRFGLWARCYFRTASEVSGGAEDCRGSLDDLGSIPSAAFKAATIFVGLSVVLSFLAICSMLLFFFFQSTTVFHICGWVQVLSEMSLRVSSTGRQTNLNNTSITFLIIDRPIVSTPASF
uniref:Uncharacterized protein n=1 Tax=Timema monikensis TaxID=170555 RepID=A0A7R9ECJ7_9NEOP|nr:unnamed protein product [Timema monikensis]